MEETSNHWPPWAKPAAEAKDLKMEIGFGFEIVLELVLMMDYRRSKYIKVQ